MPLLDRRLPLTLAASLLLTVGVFAQQGTTTTSESGVEARTDAQALPEAPKPQTTGGSTQQSSEPEKSRLKRLQDRLIAGRSLNVTNNVDAAPMSSRQKFGLFLRESADPGQFFLVGLDAGLAQATNEYKDYGQGAAGYGKRYGAALADEVSGEFFRGFLFPVILREDPRYYRKGSGSFSSRVGWALKKSFTTRTDSGNWRFGYSRVLGSVAAGTLSNAYYPSSDRGVALTAQRSATLIGFSIAGSLGQEFWPDVSGRLFGQKRKAPTAIESSTQQSGVSSQK